MMTFSCRSAKTSKIIRFSQQAAPIKRHNISTQNAFLNYRFLLLYNCERLQTERLTMRDTRKLARKVADTLQEQIAAGTLKVGDKLKSEQELCEQFAVSRTVIREAISTLVAKDLVHTRHGAGSYVKSASHPSSLLSAQTLSGGIHEALNILELRIAVEIESAGLAALRRTTLQEEDIHQQHLAFTRAIEDGQSTAVLDFAFHRAIAVATNNPVYTEIIDNLGQRSIPRTLLENDTGTLSQGYLNKLRDEHQAIMSAITEGDPEGARQAMRQHLTASQQRYRKLRSQMYL